MASTLARISYLSLIYSILLGLSCATTQNGYSDCCEALSRLLGNTVSYPDDAVYAAETNGTSSYWSQQEASLLPTCRLSPTSVEDVSIAVQILSSCQGLFAIRGGGHTPFAGAANIADGVTIDLGLMDSVSVNDDQSITSVGAGARWRDVSSKLDALNLAIVGGRVSPVGVGGLTLGGGLSFFAPRYGFVCDNVVNYQVVLASGNIIDANATHNTDLYQALKGGSNNFGVVTRFDMRTFSQMDLWGGLIVLPVTSAADQFQPLVDFNTASGAGVDSYATIFSTFIYDGALGQTLIANGPVYSKAEPYPQILRNFTSMQPQLSNTLQISSLTTITDELDAGQPNGLRQLWVTLTIGNDASLLAAIYNISNSVSSPLQNAAGIFYTLAFQPLSTSIMDKAASTGGNALGLDPNNGNRFIINVGIQWSDESDDNRIDAAAQSFLQQSSDYARKMGLLDDFVYLNYALPTQNPLAGYGSQSLQLLRNAAAKYDPGQVFQKQVPGGFKIP